jgi:hypothetical protein
MLLLLMEFFLEQNYVDCQSLEDSNTRADASRLQNEGT